MNTSDEKARDEEAYDPDEDLMPPDVAADLERVLNEQIERAVAAWPRWKRGIYHVLVFCRVPKFEIVRRL